MSFDELLIHTVSVSTPAASTTTDRYNNPIDGAPSVVSEKARIQQYLQTEEELGLRDTRISTYRVFLRPDTTITSLSTVTWGTRTFRVKGVPDLAYDHDGPHHVEAILEEIEG